MNWLTQILSDNISTNTVTGTAEPRPEEPLVKAKPTILANKAIGVEFLKHFIPLRELDEKKLGEIHQTICQYQPGDVLFINGEASDVVYYLLQGEVKIQPDSARNYQVKAQTTRSKFPLNSGRKVGSTVTAISNVVVLILPLELMRLWPQYLEPETVACLEVMDLQLPPSISQDRFFASFADAYHSNSLTLPSLPKVALTLKKAMEKDIGVKEAVQIIQIDPAIVSKLIQIANSSLYVPVSPITNCHDAVARLGLDTTRNFVMSIALKQIFHCRNKKLMSGMQTLWTNSLYISSLSYILAEASATIEPGDALLAGLVADIGAIPILHFAENYAETAPELEDLEKALPYLLAPVGSLVLHTLGVPSAISQIPTVAENWFYDSGEALTLADIVIMAKLHSYIGTKRTEKLPHINTIPAYSKLKHAQLSPDFSLLILQKAHKRIKDITSIMR